MRARTRARASAQTKTIIAPTKGLVENRPAAKPDKESAAVLENWIPTQRGVRVRGGMDRSATIGEACVSLFTWDGLTTEKLFAASADAVYDISSLDGGVTVPAESIAGQSGGYYGAQMMGTSAAEMLVIANGVDYVWYFDGSEWNPITSAAVNDVPFDAETSAFAVGETVSGGTSGASAVILGITKTSATAGTLRVGAITSGPFQNDEALTSTSGAATANGASAAGSAITITGVATAALTAPWVFAERLFFVEKNTLSAWFLPVNAIGGAASEINLQGVFKKGGALSFGGSWSIDSGDGMDDRCVFVSTKGEVAIYTGTDPSTSFVLQGRYDIGDPLGIRGHMRAGGDFMIATVDGIVPLSQVQTKDAAALSLAAVTRPIELIWGYEAAQNPESVELVKWTNEALGLVVLPSSDRSLAVNLQTGAWGISTGWTMDCAAIYAGRAFGGFADGYIRALDETGNDDGAAFVAKYCHAFMDFGNSALYKTPNMIRASFYAEAEFEFQAGVSFDYAPNFDGAPAAVDISSALNYLIWGTGKWDVNTWYSPEAAQLNVGITATWQSVYGGGYVMAPTIQITSNSTEKLNIELVHIDLNYEEGFPIV